jgi:hypothetical protein
MVGFLSPMEDYFIIKPVQQQVEEIRPVLSAPGVGDVE